MTRAYGRYVAENYPNAKIGVLYSGDGFGRDNITGFKQGLGDTAANIVAEQTYEATDPTIDSQLVKLRTSGVEVFADFTTPKFAAMAIRKTAEMGWKPVHILQGISLSIEHNSNIAYAYMSAQAMEHILRRCGDDLTRANVLKQAESLGNLELDLLLPGIKVRTSPTGHYPIRQTRMQRFDGIRWQGFGPLLQLE
jgi:branched-chain amino acid transport system substrate-binding protein